MEEIKIHHSLPKKVPLFAICILFAFFSIYLIKVGEIRIIAWLCLLFFGGGGIFIAYMMLKERITGKAYLTITDKEVRMNMSKEWSIAFADVESFTLVQHATSKMIAVNYKENVETQKIEEDTAVGRAARKTNVEAIGAQEAIPVDGLTMRPEDICKLLNERLANF